jgi:hypothetical protein
MSATKQGDLNFPADLAISPLHHPQLALISSVEVTQNVFGSSAQQSSIQKYGIAGRVWRIVTFTRYLEEFSQVHR